MNFLMNRLVCALVAAAVAGCGGVDDFGTGEDGGEETIDTVTEALSVGAIHRGNQLFLNQTLYSANCSFVLKMGGDGNLVIRRVSDGAALWASNTANNAWAFASFQNDGNFALYRRDGGTALWSSNGGSTSANRLVMQNDGNAVMYTLNNTVVWASGSGSGASSCAALGSKTSEVTEVWHNINRPGGDLAGMPITGTSAGRCGGECSTRSSCRSWTWVPGGACWLKGSVPGATYGGGMVSGEKKNVTSGSVLNP
jgi:hypothetical protein